MDGEEGKLLNGNRQSPCIVKKQIAIIILTTLALIIFSSLRITAQKPISISPKKPIVCYAEMVNHYTSFGPKVKFLRKTQQGEKSKTATFIVDYIGFDAQSQNAFQYAVDIWETVLQSPVPIRIKATWTKLDDNVLGQAIWGNAYANFDNAQKLNVFYPVALAEKMAGKHLNHPDSADIVASFNSNFTWYYGTNAQTPSNRHDLVSVILHEIGHGLGFVDSYDVSNNQGSFGVQGTGIPMIYDLPIENNAGNNLFQTYTSPSSQLSTQLTSNGLFFDSAEAVRKNNNIRPKIYAPSTFSGGSSIAHLDEATYRAGDPNSLMTPQIGQAEAMHNPGSIVEGIFSDIGWVFARQMHEPRNSQTPADPYTLLVKIESDSTYLPANVKLIYSKKSDGTDRIIDGEATANENEFRFVVPPVINADSIYYYFSVQDAVRTYTNPGKIARPRNTELQSRIAVGIAPDETAPIIKHVPVEFLIPATDKLSLSAAISDNIGLKDVALNYSINGLAKPPVQMSIKSGSESLVSASVATYSATYEAILTFVPGDLKDGDTIRYTITAIDNSLNSNVAYAPSINEGYKVAIIGLLPTQDSYSNDFNLPTTDFFGNSLFSIATPSGFSQGAIHSSHPYPNGADENNQSSFSYQLRIPVRLRATEAILRFDEIVLVEPGESGSVYGQSDFYDYVVVEGSKDGGLTWKPLADGYDSRANTDWLNRYNSSSDNANPANSTGQGDPSLYRSRSIDMLANGNFKAGDEVSIRFRLFSDQLVHGWGWAIDNLKIQVDETPPVIKHDHINYFVAGGNQLEISFDAIDAFGLSDVAIEYKVNNGTVETFSFPINNTGSAYSLVLTIEGLRLNDVIQYRINAADRAANSSVLPATDFFLVPVVQFNSPVTQYVSDFNSANNDFVGNFFSVTQPTGFSNGAIHTSHPYPLGFGVSGKSDLTYTLTKQITINEANPYIRFDEIVLVESTSTTVKDFVVVEASKDLGANWIPLVDAYAANVNTAWRNAITGSESLYRTRLIEITEKGDFSNGNTVLVRFRLNSDQQINKWGWAIDNLSIQGPITSIEEDLKVMIYPNPVASDELTIQLPSNVQDTKLTFINMQGQSISEFIVDARSGGREIRQDVRSWPSGLYLVKLSVGARSLTEKLIIMR